MSSFNENIMKRNKIVYLFIIVFLLPASGFARKKKKDSKEDGKTESRYEQLFKDKARETKRGLITLHKMEGKIYFEIPTAVMGREMLLGSTIAASTDNLLGGVGERTHTPLRVVFTLKDSNKVSLGEIQTVYTTTDDNLRERMRRGNLPAVIKNFEVQAWSPDSTGVVIDMTDFLVSDNEMLPPFFPWSPVVSMTEGRLDKNFIQEGSQVLEIKAFEDNVSVQSRLAYRVTAETFMGTYCKNKPITNVITRNFILLPEDAARPRYADPRIGVFFDGKYDIGHPRKNIDVFYHANRWRLEPKDEEAYRRGELVEPVKPIVFYVDDAFPASWLPYIRQGVLTWNEAFERIGFKNVMQVRDFPSDDPDFDPENLKYSCIRYSPSVVANAMGPSWTDPRTGEIINASVYVYHNLVAMVQDWRFLHTAPADPSVRKVKLDEETFGDCMRYVIAHEVGHCLGLMHNMSASAAIPTDSLRSPSFTRKYGTTHAIMDYARNTYVAQPGDAERGVRMTPPNLGLYDYYVIEWLYKPLLDIPTAKDEIPVLDRFISERSGDPVYRYGKQQFWNVLDPSSIEEDLGDDPVKSATYGVKNLKYLLANLNTWVAHEDKDYKFRTNMLNEARFQFFRYCVHVLRNIGGFYFNEIYEGDELPAYSVVSRERQKEALRFLLEQMKDVAWLDNVPGLPLGRDVGAEIQEEMMRGLLRAGPVVAINEKLTTDSKPFTRDEYMNDIYAFVMAPTMQNKVLTKSERSFLQEFVNSLIEETGVNRKDMGAEPFRFRSGVLVRVPESIKAKSRERYGVLGHDVLGVFSNAEYLPINAAGEVSGFGEVNLWYRPYPSEPACFKMLQRVYTLVKSKQNTGSAEMQRYYKLMARQIGNILDN